MTSGEPPRDPELLETVWDLEQLVDGGGPEAAKRMLQEASELAAELAAGLAGRVSQLDGEGLGRTMRELERIEQLTGRAASYAALGFAADTADPERGALLQLAQERATEIQTTLLFFELEWAALDDETAERLLADKELDFCRHHLRSARRYRPHLLTEPEEKVLSEKSISSQAAWTRLFGQLVSALRVKLEQREVTLDEALSRLLSVDRDTRRTAAAAVTTALEPGLSTRGFIYNTLVYDKAVEDRLRSYPHWLASRNLANQTSDESVRALIEAVRARYDVPQRWYRLKARLLGIERLADYDRSAPLLSEEVTFTFAEAREIVLDAY
jgi:oligoendopeptidase F